MCGGGRGREGEGDAAIAKMSIMLCGTKTTVED